MRATYRLKILIPFLSVFLFLDVSQANSFETMFAGQRDWHISDVWSSNEKDWQNLREHLSTSARLAIVCNGENSISLQTETYNFRVELTRTERLSGNQVRNIFTRNLYTDRNSDGDYTKELDRQGYHQFVFQTLSEYVSRCRRKGPLASANTAFVRAREKYRNRGQKPELVQEAESLTRPFRSKATNQ